MTPLPTATEDLLPSMAVTSPDVFLTSVRGDFFFSRLFHSALFGGLCRVVDKTSPSGVLTQGSEFVWVLLAL